VKVCEMSTTFSVLFFSKTMLFYSILLSSVSSVEPSKMSLQCLWLIIYCMALKAVGKFSFGRSIRPGLTLDPSVGVVYFHEQTRSVCTTVMKQLQQKLPVALRTRVTPGEGEYLVKRNEDICGVPLTKMCIMFAEFHSR